MVYACHKFIQQSNSENFRHCFFKVVHVIQVAMQKGIVLIHIAVWYMIAHDNIVPSVMQGDTAVDGNIIPTSS